ncbi:hypothetical protein [Salidesulfovibrio brasiliensis]|uniref:hypothetical protein n=1 Tax=Salidesulfovibrio brasiliensis TaxID=221711 RepID=UPI000AC53D88|nr:hypothetical protein [Salidesulfovibrio brasiliensis]
MSAAACAARRKHAFRVVHELPRRLRLRSRRLYDPNLDRDYLRAVVEALPGVDSATVNTAASCIVIEYDGKPETRSRVLAFFGKHPS